MTSWLQLANKTAIVTGAGSGIGAAVALELVKQQCRVVLADASPDKLEEVTQTCRRERESSTTTSIVMDVTNPTQVESLIQQADDFSNGTSSSILVNCAGITQDALIHKMTLDQWDNVLNVNLRGTFLTCREFCSSRTTPASIINVGSVVSEQGNMGQVNYAASKGGVLGLTRALAKEMAMRNIRVNAVVPGFIDTAMTQAVPKHVCEEVVKKIPLGKFGKPTDVANLVLFLASCQRSGYITGECMTCSGMISF